MARLRTSGWLFIENWASYRRTRLMTAAWMEMSDAYADLADQHSDEFAKQQWGESVDRHSRLMRAYGVERLPGLKYRDVLFYAEEGRGLL